jgi:hypothetical protein
MIAHIYPSVLQAVSGRGYAGCLDGCFQGYRAGAMQNPACELPRISIPRTSVNKGRRDDRSPFYNKGQSFDLSASLGSRLHTLRTSLALTTAAN